MKINNHILEGEKVKFQMSPNKGKQFGKNLPDTIIIHYTAGSNMASAVNTLSSPASKASAHLVVGKDGSVAQLVPFNTISWHAGNSSWKGRNGLNSYSIGIEIDNAGVMTKTGDVFRSWFGKSYTADQVMKGIHRNESVERYWEIYTEKQIQAVIEICTLLIKEYGIKEILGHEEIAPGRKSDPGPAFPLDKIRSNLLNSNRSENGKAELPDTGVVSAADLNIRKGPDVKAEMVAPPLKKDSKVKILEEKDGWYRVIGEVEGWVAAKYVSVK